MWTKRLFKEKRKINRQKEFLTQLENKLTIHKPIFVDRNLVEWKTVEEQTGIKIWAIDETKLSKATDLQSENIIGRYKVIAENSNDSWELWFDLDCNRDIRYKSVLQNNFKKLKTATLKVVDTLLWFGIPEEAILIKSSGRGFHIHTFVSGIRSEEQYQTIVRAICEKTDLPNVNTREYRNLKDYIFGLDVPTLCKTKTKIRAFGGCNDKLTGIFHYCSFITVADLRSSRKYPHTQLANKVRYPPIIPFKIDNRFIRKVHQVSTQEMTAKFRSTGKVNYDLDGDVKQLYKCPLVAELVKEAKENQHLTNAERVFLSQLFPFFGRKGEKELHEILKHCSDYDHDYSQYQIDAMKRSNRKPITCRWANKNIGCPEECKGIAGKSPIKLAWKPKSLDEVKDVFKKWLYLKTPSGEYDLEAIDILLAVACDRMVAGDPVWLFLVAPSGCSKTTLIKSLNKWQVYSLDKLTPQTLVSGLIQKDDAGNITKVKGILKDLDGKILTLKDFTTILQMKSDYRNAIFGQLRSAYDGYFEAGYGTMEKPVRIQSTFGLIAGVTPVIDVYGTFQSLLGERYLKLRLFYDREKSLDKAMKTVGKEREMFRELQNAVCGFLKNVDFSYEIDFSGYEQKLMKLALLVAQLRTTVWKKGFHIDEFVTTTEYATRLVKQFTKLLMLIGYVRGKKTIEEEDFQAVVRVGLNTPPIERALILLWLYKQGESETVEMAKQIRGLTYRLVDRTLDEMVAIGQLVIQEGETWRIHPKAKEYLDVVLHFPYEINVYTKLFYLPQSQTPSKTHPPLSTKVNDYVKPKNTRKRYAILDDDELVIEDERDG